MCLAQLALLPLQQAVAHTVKKRQREASDDDDDEAYDSGRSSCNEELWVDKTCYCKGWNQVQKSFSSLGGVHPPHNSTGYVMLFLLVKVGCYTTKGQRGHEENQLAIAEAAPNSETTELPRTSVGAASESLSAQASDAVDDISLCLCPAH